MKTLERVAGQAGRYEAALWIVLGALAFLAKDNPRLVMPQCLWLFGALMLMSLVASVTVRVFPGKALATAAPLAGCFVVIAAIQDFSGGADSDLWVLYLLPIFSAAILLGGRETGWIAFGAAATNVLEMGLDGGVWNATALFALTLKTSILVGAACATWGLSRSEREAHAREERQHEEVLKLESSLKEAEDARSQDQGVAAVALGGAGAVHDLGTPLMVILGFAALRREDPETTDAVRADMARIERAARYCQELVASILSRHTSPARVRSLSEIAESALLLCEEPLRVRGVSIRREYATETLTVVALGQDLERVLVNIVGNAAKAMPGGGHITITAARVGGSGSAQASLVIDDDGPGIPAEMRARLFTPFATTRAREGGTGLGLYLCREIARRHGGDISAGDAPGHGARFILTLPLAEAVGALGS